MKHNKAVDQIKTFFTYLALITGSVLFMIPLVWTFATALKGEKEVPAAPERFLPHAPTLENFGLAWKALPFSDFVWNTGFGHCCGDDGNPAVCFLGRFPPFQGFPSSRAASGSSCCSWRP